MRIHEHTCAWEKSIRKSRCLRQMSCGQSRQNSLWWPIRIRMTIFCSPHPKPHAAHSWKASCEFQHTYMASAQSAECWNNKDAQIAHSSYAAQREWLQKADNSNRHESVAAGGQCQAEAGVGVWVLLTSAVQTWQGEPFASAKQ